MKGGRFLGYSVLLLLLVVALDALGGLFLGEVQHKVAVCSHCGVEYAMCEVNTDVVVIGSSRAKHHYVSSILADSLGLSVFNCGRNGENLRYQTAVLNGILNRYAPKLVVWNFEPRLMLEVDEASLKDAFSRLSVLAPFATEDEFVREVLHVCGAHEDLKLCSHLFCYNSLWVEFLYLFCRKNRFHEGYLPLPVSGYAYPVLCNKNYDRVFEVSRLHRFERMLLRCKEMGVPVVLCFSPRFEWDGYRDAVSYRAILEVTHRLEVPLFDFYHHPAFMTDSTCFHDVNHMNHRGAVRFSGLLGADLKRWLTER